MTKSELIELLARRQPHLKADDVDLAVKSLLEMMGGALALGERIEVRGFGSFSLHYRPPRTGRSGTQLSGVFPDSRLFGAAQCHARTSGPPRAQLPLLAPCQP